MQRLNTAPSEPIFLVGVLAMIIFMFVVWIKSPIASEQNVKAYTAPVPSHSTQTPTIITVPELVIKS